MGSRSVAVAPPIRIIGDAQLAAMGGHDRGADREAEAQALWLGGEEGLEQHFLLPGADAMAAVRDDHLGPLGAGPRADADEAFHRVERAHESAALIIRFSSTCCSWIGSPSTGARSSNIIESHARLAADKLGMHELQGRRDEAVEVEKLGSMLALAQQSAQAADDLAGAVVLLHDVVQHFAQLGEIGLRHRQHAAARLGVGEDRGERLIDLMRDRARKLAQERDPHQMRELATLLLDLDLRTLERRDVGKDAADAQELSGIVIARLRARIDPVDLATDRNPKVPPRRRPAMHGGAHRLGEGVAIVGSDDVQHAFERQGSVGGDAEHGAAMLCRPQAVAADVALPEADMGRGRRECGALLAFLQGLLGAPAFGVLHQNHQEHGALQPDHGGADEQHISVLLPYARLPGRIRRDGGLLRQRGAYRRGAYRAGNQQQRAQHHGAQ